MFTSDRAPTIAKITRATRNRRRQRTDYAERSTRRP